LLRNYWRSPPKKEEKINQYLFFKRILRNFLTVIKDNNQKKEESDKRINIG